MGQHDRSRIPLPKSSDRTGGLSLTELCRLGVMSPQLLKVGWEPETTESCGNARAQPHSGATLLLSSIAQDLPHFSFHAAPVALSPTL
jgi:hypothetical protein